MQARRTYAKADFPVHEIRRYLEPGPVVLVSSAAGGAINVMTMGWHTVMEFSPSLVGCVIASGNHSHAMIRGSGQCVINIPTADLAPVVADIGNCSGADVDKFTHFGLTPVRGRKVAAPLIAECYASFECVVADTSLLRRYDFFVLEVVKAHVARKPRYPTTIHYRGDGIFMVSGRHLNLKRRFRDDRL